MSDLLLSIPLKTSYEVALVEPLKQALKEGGYSASQNQGNIEEFQKFRNQVIKTGGVKGAQGLELLYRYHDQLLSLTKKLPHLQVKPMNVTIYWDDALDKGGLFGGKSNCTTPSLEVERLCIIFNIGALQSQLAAEARAQDTDEELKNAAKYYQSAASIMHCLSEAKVEGVTLTQDLKADTLTALSALMLAQAQEVFIDKAVKDRMKETVIAKLCVQAEDMFADAAAKLNKDTIKHLWDRGWCNNVAAKKLGCEALSQYFQSQVAISKKHYGEQIGRLDLFLKTAKKAQDKMGSSAFLKTFVEEGEAKYRQAKKDNDFIYHESIPHPDNLDPIERGGPKLVKINPVPEQFSSNFVDIFEGAVRKGGEEGDNPSIKSIINTAAGQLGQYLVNLSKK